MSERIDPRIITGEVDFVTIKQREIILMQLQIPFFFYSFCSPTLLLKTPQVNAKMNLNSIV